jgi:DNA-binding MarR family transcriptional regulator
VQRIVNDLQKLGFVTLEENPHHRRASLVALTEKGRGRRRGQPPASAMGERPST